MNNHILKLEEKEFNYFIVYCPVVESPFILRWCLKRLSENVWPVVVKFVFNSKLTICAARKFTVDFIAKSNHYIFCCKICIDRTKLNNSRRYLCLQGIICYIECSSIFPTGLILVFYMLIKYGTKPNVWPTKCKWNK